MASLIDNQERTLEQALKNTLSQTESVDILTAFFYFSGFSMLADELADKKIRILVGKTIDPTAINELSSAISSNPNIGLDMFQNRKFHSMNRNQKRDEYTESFIQLFNKSALSEAFDSSESQRMHKIFEQKLKDGSLEIKMTGGDNHAKVYIFTNKAEFSANGDSKGVVFMGSSNFTYSGLLGQGELNQRFSDNQDYDNYKSKFDKLWDNSNAIDISTENGNDDFIKAIEKKLWIHSVPDPYKIFIRILYELYYQPENENIKPPHEITEGKFSNLKYQLDAIRGGIDCISKNNGVIIADVVGLGKSVIASSIAHNLDIRKCIIISPPHLIQQWKDYVQDFGIRGALVESGGKIKELHSHHAFSKQPILFIIDEAHRYRNELTDDYQLLHQLTRSNVNNKVMLLTATPYNNRPQDLFALVKLFQTPNRSTIHSVDNLSLRFHELISQYKKLERLGKKDMTEKVKKSLQKLSQELRVLIEPVVIRRSRIDLKQIKEYALDIENQGISFPDIIGPELVSYDLGSIEEAYIETLIKLTDENGFIGARYMPTKKIHEHKEKEFLEKYSKFFDDSDLKTAQTNLAQFMKRLLVTRFESSKFAFRSTLDKIIASCEKIIEWWEEGYVPILKKGTLSSPDNVDIDEILELLEDNASNESDVEKVKKIAIPIPNHYFKPEFIDEVRHDVGLLSDIRKKWFKNDEIGFDPKQECVETKIKELLSENLNRKIVIFSSYADTAEWVAQNLQEHGFSRTVLYTGASDKIKRQVISDNFDASVPISKQKNDFDIIVATDALSEGFNLHRAGIVINYDIPYNPTRVVQRIGRINRINKKVFDEIFIFNFFPTEIGADITNIKGISTMKMLLINCIVGSDTKTLTPDEDLQSYFKNQYKEADSTSDEATWDNEYRNIYASVRHNVDLVQEVLEIPERTRVIRKEQGFNISVSFAKRGNGVLFALANEDEITATIVTPEQALKYFKAEPSEKSYEGDYELDTKFEVLREKIMAPHPLPKLEGRRAIALNNIQFFSENYHRERDYFLDLTDVIETYDDLSDGELKFIAQLEMNSDDLQVTVDEIMKKFPSHYIGVIKERAEAIDSVTETIMFTEDIRK
jgi:ERCC4-related helicase/HKD family nuclease